MLLAHKVRSLLIHKSFQNFTFLFITQVSNILISVLSIPLIFKALGTEAFGLVNAAFTIMITMALGISYGYHLSGPREVAIHQDNHQKLSEIFTEIFSSKLILAFISLLLIWGGSFLGAFSRYSDILLFSSVMILAEAFFPLWFMQGVEEVKLLTISNLCGKLLYILSLVFFIQSPSDAVWVNFSFGASALLVNIGLIFYVIKKWKITLFIPKLKALVNSLKENFSLFISSVAGYLTVNGGVIILSFTATGYELGSFGLAERVIRVVRLFPSIMAQAIYPHASRLYQQDRLSFFRFVKKTYAASLLLTLMGSVLLYLLAPYIIYFFAKDPLEDAVLLLRVLSLVPFLATLNIANVLLVLVKSENKLLLKSTFISFVFMLLVATLGAQYYGALGMSIGLLLTELMFFASQTWINYRYIKSDTIALYGRYRTR